MAHIRNVLLAFNQQYVRLILAQMQEHFVEEATEYEIQIRKEFHVLTPSSFNAPEDETPRPFRQSVDNKKDIPSMLVEGFEKCLYPVQKYNSDTERRFSVILENGKSVTKWVKTSKGNFRIHYTADAEYEPDFVAETADTYYLCEPKDDTEVDDDTIQAKARAAAQCCKQATDVSSKPWKYLLIPDTAVDESKSLAGSAAQ